MDHSIMLMLTRFWRCSGVVVGILFDADQALKVSRLRPGLGSHVVSSPESLKQAKLYAKKFAEMHTYKLTCAGLMLH